MGEHAQVIMKQMKESEQGNIKAYDQANVDTGGYSVDVGATVTVCASCHGGSICEDGGSGPWTAARFYESGGGSDSICIRTNLLSGTFATSVSMS